MKKLIELISFVLMLSPAFLQINEPILPADYVQNLGYGFDVTWSEFRKYMDLYSTQAVVDFAQKGFKNVRIRMNQPNPDQEFMERLKSQVQDCLDNGISPILSYQAHNMEESNDHAANKAHLVAWWGAMAKAFVGYSYKLSFNILIEISGVYKTDYERINDFYASVLEQIRKFDSYRIVIFPPVKLSSPDYLQYLKVPGGQDEKYTMVEWHFYAAGPNPNETSKKYWYKGKTQLQRDNVLNPIKIAVDWAKQNNYVTWVGAWMPGNYNKGHNYNIAEQVRFGSFMARSLAANNIPWSVNAGNKFYDYQTNKWYPRTSDAGGIPVIDAMLNPEKISLYEDKSYKGASIRLGEGSYDKQDLNLLGFIRSNSIMVPIDYEVKLYTQTAFAGEPIILTKTTINLDNIDIKSLQILYIPFS